MFTVCPKCAMTLAVTAEDLRIGQGYVRCGRCLNVFNALLTLTDEPVSAPVARPPPTPPADPAGSPQVERALTPSDAGADADTDTDADTDIREPIFGLPRPPKDAAALTEDAVSAPDAPAESTADAAEPEPAGDSLPADFIDASAEGIETDSSDADGTGTFETIVLEGDAITQTEEFVPEASVDSEIAALTERLGDRGGADGLDENDIAVDEVPAARSARDGLPADVADAINALRLNEPAARSEPAAQHLPWVIASVLLAVLLCLLLAAQALNHWRDELASSPRFGAAITQLYARLGVPLDPHWNLAAYDVRQEGAQADGTDAHVIRVRLSIANRALRAQPTPLLRLTLLDRYGKRLGTRELTPAEYWPQGLAARAFLQHDERIDSEVSVRDPEATSSSFELDVCLRPRPADLECASDLSTATTAANTVP